MAADMEMRLNTVTGVEKIRAMSISKTNRVYFLAAFLVVLSFLTLAVTTVQIIDQNRSKIAIIRVWNTLRIEPTTPYNDNAHDLLTYLDEINMKIEQHRFLKRNIGDELSQLVVEGRHNLITGEDLERTRVLLLKEVNALMAHVENTALSVRRRYNTQLLSSLSLFLSGAALLIMRGAQMQKSVPEPKMASSHDDLHREISKVERSLLASALHDGPSQLLTRTLLDIDQYLELHSGEDTPHPLYKTRTYLNEAIQDIYGIITDFRIAEIESSHMETMLQYLAFRVGSVYTDTSFTVQLTVPWPNFDPEVNYHIYSIVREALNNVGRHAEAQMCVITNRIERNTLLVEVTDDGVGMHETVGRIGISGMKQRARLADADITWKPNTQGGTDVVVGKKL